MLIIEHFMEDYPQGVYVTLVGVDGFSLAVVKEYFRGHGVGSAAFFAEDGQLRANGFGKAEIRYLDSAVL